jgi:hypothetical protein
MQRPGQRDIVNRLHYVDVSNRCLLMIVHDVPHVTDRLALVLRGTDVSLNPPRQMIHPPCKACVAEMIPSLIEASRRSWHYRPGVVG